VLLTGIWYRQMSPNQMYKHKQAQTSWNTWMSVNGKAQNELSVRWMVGQVWMCTNVGWMSADKHETAERWEEEQAYVWPSGVVAMMTVVTVAKAAVMVVGSSSNAAPLRQVCFTPPASPFFFFWSFPYLFVLVIFSILLYFNQWKLAKRKKRKPTQPVFYKSN